MAKLNKQEKEYMVRRIRDEVEKALTPFPKMTLSLNEAVKNAAEDWSLALKSYEEMLDNINKVISTSGNWTPSVPLDLLIQVPEDYADEKEAFDKVVELRGLQKEKLMNKAQPFIDSVNLGESVSSDLASFIASIQTSD